MARVWSVLVVMVACLVAVNFASAQEKKKHGDHKGGHMDPAARWAAIAKGADKADATELTKDEFVKGVKATSQGKMADHAEDFFKRIKKASEDKITKDEYIAGVKEMFSKHKKGDKKPADK